jgi:hypothetical protein
MMSRIFVGLRAGVKQWESARWPMKVGPISEELMMTRSHTLLRAAAWLASASTAPAAAPAGKSPGTVYGSTTFPLAADSSAARQTRTASMDSSGVMTAGFRPVRMQLAK